MGTFGSFEISASGMDVERTRLEVAALNLANARTTGGSSGTAFHRQVVVARATAGSRSAEVGMPGPTGQAGPAGQAGLGGLAGLSGLARPALGGFGMEGLGSNPMALLRSAIPGGGMEGSGPSGVHVAAVVDDPSPGRREYAPGHPDADAEGFVTMPAVDAVTEMVEVMMATRGFEANSTAFAAARDMATRAIDIGRA